VNRASKTLVFSLIFAALAIATPEAGGQGREFNHDEARTLANDLGLGTRLAATLLLNGGFPASWVAAAGGEEPPGYLQWPVPGHRLGRGFGSNGGRHLAVDVTAETGTPVHVMAPGIVGYAADEVKGYGNLVLVLHPGGWVTLYAHLDGFKTEPGQRVERGDVIGTVGNTGISRGSHLHFALHIRGEPVDPMKHMRGAPDRTITLSLLGLPAGR